MLEMFEAWDSKLFVFLNNLGIEQFDSLWIFITQIESWIPLFIYFTVLIFYFYGGKKGFVVFFFATLTFTIALALSSFAKEYYGRLRPNNTEELSGFIRILQDPNSFSFFSGHASSSVGITTFLVLMLRKFHKWIYLVFLWPVLFVLSRIYVGVHYPADILAGTLVGVVIAFLIRRICMKLLVRL
ncbi:MAG: undecaprenyl-diphosphatase [Candidatus Latescibacterota bacterium]|jgi:undecaprenyl-diphosphatase